MQTNEVQRSWALLPLFLWLCERSGAQTLDLIELGPSAGFNLVWDRYRYRYDGGQWGPAEAPLELAGTERRRVPEQLLRLTPTVRGRIGIDLEPVDVTDPENVLLLKSFVWAGQEERLERIDRAVEAVRQDPSRIVQGDYVELLPEVLAERREGALTIVFQTASMVYLSEEQRARVYAALEAASRETPVGWVSTTHAREGTNGSGLEARLLPGKAQLLAEMDFHGSWLEWLGAP